MPDTPKDDSFRKMMENLQKQAKKSDPVPSNSPPPVKSFPEVFEFLVNSVIKDNPKLANTLLSLLEDIAFSSDDPISLKAYDDRQKEVLEKAGSVSRHLTVLGNRELAFKVQVAVAKVAEIMDKEVIPYMISVGKLKD